jgi:hypothetical protein
MIYDTSDAYDLPWFEALKKINNCLQVTQATPVVPENKTEYITKIEGKRSLLSKDRHIETYEALESREMPLSEVQKIVKEKTDQYPSIGIFKTMEKLGTVSVRKQVNPRDKGSLNFDMYHPNKARTGLVRGENYFTTQDGFVQYLITGNIEEL